MLDLIARKYRLCGLGEGPVLALQAVAHAKMPQGRLVQPLSEVLPLEAAVADFMPSWK